MLMDRESSASCSFAPFTFPARQYSVNGERRSFALLRPIVDITAQEKIRTLILEAFQEYEERATVPS